MKYTLTKLSTIWSYPHRYIIKNPEAINVWCSLNKELPRQRRGPKLALKRVTVAYHKSRARYTLRTGPVTPGRSHRCPAVMNRSYKTEFRGQRGESVSPIKGQIANLPDLLLNATRSPARFVGFGYPIFVRQGNALWVMAGRGWRWGKENIKICKNVWFLKALRIPFNDST